MIPNHDGKVGEIRFVTKPSRTYRMHKEKNYLAGRTDGLLAVQQAVYLLLNIERYQYPIYSWNYGVELADLFGKPTNHVCAQLPGRIREALLQDDRIEAVDGFAFERKRGTIAVQFTVHTKYGSFQETKELKV